MMTVLVLFFIFLYVSTKTEIFINEFYILDIWSLMLSSIIPLMYLMTSSNYYFNNSNEYNNNFMKLMKLFIYILTLLCFMTSSMILFLFYLELVIIPMSWFIFSESKDKFKMDSLMFMFMMNFLGSILFMVSIYQILKSYNTISFDLLFMSSSYMNSNLVYLFFLMMLMMKTPVFLFHVWLTKAHVNASAFSSMILSGIMLKLVILPMWKYSKIFLKNTTIFSFTLAYSLFFMIIISLSMLRSVDLKNTIACSSIFHMSMMLPSCMYMSTESAIACLMCMVIHGISSPFLFKLVSISYEFSGSRNYLMNKSMFNFSSSLILVMYLFMFINLSMPPFMSFYSELMFLKMSMKISMSTMIMLGLILSTSIIFTMFFFMPLNFGKKSLLIKMTSVLNILKETYIYLLSMLCLPLMF